MSGLIVLAVHDFQKPTRKPACTAYIFVFHNMNFRCGKPVCLQRFPVIGNENLQRVIQRAVSAIQNFLIQQI